MWLHILNWHYYTTNRNSSQYEGDIAIEGEREVQGKNNRWLSEKRQHWTPMNDHYESNMYLENDFNESNNKS